MAVFFSYSHQDADFVDLLANALVAQNTHVWIDRWEINVGDSLLDKVQSAIANAGALLVVLSRASVASEWCRRELNAGLMRELDERSVLLIPILKEECTVPPFLREKKYADFRTSFDDGLHSLSATLARFTNLEQGRIDLPDASVIDWAEDWFFDSSHLFHLRFFLVERFADYPFSLLVAIDIRCNDVITAKIQRFNEHGLGWVQRNIIPQQLGALAGEGLQVLVNDAHEKTLDYRLEDGSSRARFDIHISCRRLGQDNGSDQLVRVSNYFRLIAEHVSANARPLTNDEAALAFMLT